MKFQTRQLLIAAAIAAFFSPAFAGFAADAQATSPAGEAVSNSDSTLRRLDSPSQATVAAAAQKDDSDDRAAPEEKKARPRRHTADHQGDRVTIASDNHIAEDEKVPGDAVAVMGDLTVDGSVAGDAVAVIGDNTINGPVDGDAVAVMGDLKLGPKARVGGDVVCIGGTLQRDPQAVIDGKIVNQSAGKHFHGFTPLHMFGALQSFRSVWFWVFNLAIIALYALVALLFPRAVRSVGDKLVEQPGMSLLAAFLTVLALPVVFLILCVTVIGIPLAILLVPAFIALMMFGKASFYALMGRKITQDRLHLSIAVLIGGLVCCLFFFIPFIGLMLTVLVSLLMVGCCVTAIFGAGRKQAAPPAPVGPMAGAPGAAGPRIIDGPGPAVSAFAAAAAVPPSISAPPPTDMSPLAPSAESQPNPPPFQAEPPPMAPPAPATPAAATHLPLATAGMPRAGFWIRTAALLVDLILAGVAVGLYLPHGIPILLAAYAACLWKYRGSTIGGIVFGLRVVRMDDRPIDWTTSIVRALGCFLSLIAVGIGFIWVAFDPERQSWHDKIAGTTVVRPPKGVSLV
jgi:uncharacterized RDD family membrane protein YckC/cytoskeletal protein CcmA (bactofilin family)